MASPAAAGKLLLIALIIVTPSTSSSPSPFTRLALGLHNAGFLLEDNPPAKRLLVNDETQPPPPPQVFFEVARPVLPPKSLAPCVSVLLLRHAFANDLGLPPTMANYTPPDGACEWGQVVLRWSGACKGRQFDRIAAVWMGGVELLRTSTPEPTRQGITWHVSKDVTRYVSLLATPQPLVVSLGNVVDATFTGIFYVNLTLEFFSTTSFDRRSEQRQRRPYPLLFNTPADLIQPISAPSALPSGHWFHISGEMAAAHYSVSSIPTNLYRAVLEMYVSFHGDDETWFTNPPNGYITTNNLTGVAGNGPFREVQAYLDGKLIAAVWPFPVVYTGGINPLFWRPAAAISAFNLPTYDFELTPLLGSLVDGQPHTFIIKVENALDYWLLDANLHLWLDHAAPRSTGLLLSFSAPPLSTTITSHFKGLNGTSHTRAARTLSYSGFVTSSMGNFTMSAAYHLVFDTVLTFLNSSHTQTATQKIHAGAKIKAETPSGVVFLQQTSSSFPLNLACLQYEGANNSVTTICNFSHAFNDQVSTFSTSGSSFSSLKNRQQAQGMITAANNLVTSGYGAMQQEYSFKSNDACYARNLSTFNSTMLHDCSSTNCSSIH